MWEDGKENQKKKKFICIWNIYKGLQFIQMLIASCSNTECMNNPISAGLKQIIFSCRSPNFSSTVNGKDESLPRAINIGGT